MNQQRVEPELERRQAAAVELVKALMERYASYHDHKENMAYGGLTVFSGAVVASLVSDAWPPKWGAFTPTLAPGAAILLLLVTLTYLRYQLHRRRWAALRMAGCEHLLARWVNQPATSEDLTPRLPSKSDASDRLGKLLSWLWPRDADVKAVETGVATIGDISDAVYPSQLVKAWEGSSTSAIHHERLIIVSAWILGAAMLVRSWSCPCAWRL